MTLVPIFDDSGPLITADIPLSAPHSPEGSVCARVLQLNRPGKRNALNTLLLELIQEGLEAAHSDPRVRGIVLCSSGGTFSAGGDVKEFDGTSASRTGVMTRSKLLLDIAAQLEDSPLPTLAVVTGLAAGGGAVLALACDMAIATPDMRLGFPELRSSVVPSLVMPCAIAAFGRRLAFDLLTSGRYLDVHEAVARGVITRVANPSDVRQAASDILSDWAAVDADAMVETKRLLNEMQALPRSDAAQTGLDATAKLWTPRKI